MDGKLGERLEAASARLLSLCVDRERYSLTARNIRDSVKCNVTKEKMQTTFTVVDLLGPENRS